jgi:hypothetical protein
MSVHLDARIRIARGIVASTIAIAVPMFVALSVIAAMHMTTAGETKMTSCKETKMANTKEKVSAKERRTGLKNKHGIVEAGRLINFPLSEIMTFLKAKGLRYETGGIFTGHREAGTGSTLYLVIELPYGASSVQLSFVSEDSPTAVSGLNKCIPIA